MATPAEQARLALLEEFRRTALERLERINILWICAEGAPDEPEHAEQLLRELHTLKGESKMMGFADVSLLSHRAETLVLTARDKKFAVEAEVGDLLLGLADTIGTLLQKRAGTDTAGPDLSELMDRLDAALVQLQPEMAAKKPKTRSPKKEAPKPRLAQQTKPTERVKAERFLRVDTELMTEFSETVSESIIRFTRLEDTLVGMRELEQELADALSSHRTAVAMGAGTNGSSGARWAEIMGGVHRRLTAISDAYSHRVHEGATTVRELDRKVRALRLVPVSGLLQRYVRAVRDLAREQEKEIDVDLDVTGVSLDKHILDKLAEPILHLVRNCVDHGIEGPEERESGGKERTAHLTLAARERSGWVTVTIEDDGRGIDPTVIAVRAVQLGLVTAQEARQADDDAILGLMFSSGFSTRSEVTETSGRGVGLNVVRREVERLGGTVQVRTEVGTGTRFVLKVPVMLALTRVLIVRAGKEWYALPANLVESLITLDDENVEVVNQQRMVRHFGELVPVAPLNALVEGEGEAGLPDRAAIIRYEGVAAAVAVNEWRSDVEVLVYPLSELLADASLVAGSCVAREGDLVLVLNPGELIARALGEAPRIRFAATMEPEHATPTILLVEDSAITRSMVSRILVSFGYQVLEAENGQQGIERLGSNQVDLVLTDLDMPVMDGIEMVRRIRSRDAWRHLPVLVLSTRGEDVDKRRASDAGADGYLVKSEFSQSALQDAVGRRLRDWSAG